MKLRWFGVTLSALACMASVGCLGRVAHNLPPSQRLLEPGPGVGGPGPGVIQPAAAMMPMGPMGPGCGPGGCAPGGGGGMCGIGGGMSQIAFLGVEGGEVAWDVSGNCLFDSTPLVMPGRQNFSQGAIYRLKLTNVPDRAGVELYPTLEIAPVTPRTDAYLAHSPIPVQFTDEDLDQVLSGNFVTKVIYLPDPEFQELALAGVETLVSTRLDPGVDPIAEADRRGAILAILRIGNLDLQMPGQMLAMNGGIEPAQYYDGQEVPMDGGAEGMDYASGPQYGGGYCPPGGGYGAPMGPQGMPTAGFAPQVAPPGVISGINGPQYGMPITGTPIGLPGPPHIPLGHPAGLVKHEMKNRTRVLMPPPVHKMKVTVKQRPGMDYPRPVNRVNISETNRAPFRLFGGTVPPLLSGLGAHKTAEECPPQ
ncbi:MAG TPA: hypothetical protein VEQ85_12600 [Lacipirellulaceae bacterium]|nr:hypothetical protein [Lacipirellulaceae bacterium]